MTTRAFSYGHPFWQRAVEMRQLSGGGATIYEILKAAHEAGHADLTYRQIAYGLRRAPQDAMLPTRSARFLRERFGEASARFNSYVSMRDLAQEALAQVAELEEEIASPETTPLREQYLRSELWRWYQRAFEWSKECSDIALKIDAQGLNPKTLASGVDEDDSAPEIASARERRLKIDMEQERLLAEFNSRIPPPPMESLAKMYGGDNVQLRASDAELDEEFDDDDEVI